MSTQNIHFHFHGEIRKKDLPDIPLIWGPASVAQSYVLPTGYQEVTGLIHVGYGNILSWRMIMKYF